MIRSHHVVPPLLLFAFVVPVVQASMLLTSAVTAPTDAGTSFWALFYTTLLTFVFQAFRDWRDRKWKRQDEEEKRRLEERAEDNANAIRRMNETLVGKIDENTAVNREALVKSNDLNEKTTAAQVTVAKAAETVAKAAEVVAAKAQEPPSVQT